MQFVHRVAQDLGQQADRSDAERCIAGKGDIDPTGTCVDGLVLAQRDAARALNLRTARELRRVDRVSARDQRDVTTIGGHRRIDLKLADAIGRRTAIG